jgi:hypothetical protein
LLKRRELQKTALRPIQCGRWRGVTDEQLAHGLCVDTGMEPLPEVVVAEALRYVS